MLTVREVESEEDMQAFVRFPFQLYKNDKYWVPPLMQQELETLNTKKNPVFDMAEIHLFLAYRYEKLVGRIAAIIHWTEVQRQERKKMRFGWFDVIDDLQVSHALMEEVEKLGRKKRLSFIEGPVGFSNMDKAGLLTEGFRELPTMATLYNHPYYVKHLLGLGFEKGAEWVEYSIKVPTQVPKNIQRFASLIKERYNLKATRFKSRRKLAKQVDVLFELIDQTHRTLESYVPISRRQKRYYTKKFIRFIQLDYVITVSDANGRMIAFAIAMPSNSKALQKSKGKLLAFAFFQLLMHNRKNATADLCLIGIKPEFQKKGVTALIFNEMMKTFKKHGIKTLESNPELVENKSVQALWRNYEHRKHKVRSTFRKAITKE